MPSGTLVSSHTASKLTLAEVPQVNHRIGQNFEGVMQLTLMRSNRSRRRRNLSSQPNTRSIRIEPLFEYGSVEERLAASLGDFSTTRIGVNVGYHAAIENGFAVRGLRSCLGENAIHGADRAQIDALVEQAGVDFGGTPNQQIAAPSTRRVRLGALSRQAPALALAAGAQPQAAVSGRPGGDEGWRATAPALCRRRRSSRCPAPEPPRRSSRPAVALRWGAQQRRNFPKKRPARRPASLLLGRMNPKALARRCRFLTTRSR